MTSRPGDGLRSNTLTLEAQDKSSVIYEPSDSTPSGINVLQQAMPSNAVHRACTCQDFFSQERKRVKITGWRLLNSLFIFTFGVWKAASAYLGYSTLPTTIDWIVGVAWALISYWVGLLESECPTVEPWFFQDDLKGVLTVYGVYAISIILAILLYAWAFIFGLDNDMSPERITLVILGALVGIPITSLILAGLLSGTIYILRQISRVLDRSDWRMPRSDPRLVILLIAVILVVSYGLGRSLAIRLVDVVDKSWLGLTSVIFMVFGLWICILTAFYVMSSLARMILRHLGLLR